MSGSTTVRDLTNARDKIAQGWIQGSEMSSDGKHRYFCSIGAIRFAILEDLPLGSRTFKEVSDRIERDCLAVSYAIAELYPDVYFDGDVIDWNDDTRRIQDQVVEAFDRAIKIAERDDL